MAFLELESFVLGVLLSILATCIYFSLPSSPLTQIPGPWYAPYTTLILKYHVITGRRMYYIHSLHTHYGPYTRIAPNEISVSDPATYLSIHKIGSKFTKTEWYHSFMHFRYRMIFTISDPKTHGERRKLYSKALGEGVLRRKWQGTVKRKAELVARKVKEEGGGDVFEWFAFFAMDLISELTHGRGLGQVESGKPNEYFLALQKAHLGAVLGSEIPGLRRLCCMLPVQFLQETFSTTGILHRRGVEEFERTSKENPHTLTNSLQREKGKLDIPFSREDAIGEAAGIIVAGTDTTMTTSTYLIWAILSQPALQKKIEAEVAGLEEGYRIEDVEKLPVLTAAIQETLRLYCAVQGAMPRQVPPEGAQVGPYFLPGGTIVSSQIYTLHRDPAVWGSDAETFDHSRWLGQKTPASYSPWGHGSFSCVGRFFAEMELHMLATAFFRECKGAGLAQSTTKESMEMVNYFQIAPKAESCAIVV